MRTYGCNLSLFLIASVPLVLDTAAVWSLDFKFPSILLFHICAKYPTLPVSRRRKAKGPLKPARARACGPFLPV